MISPSLLRYHMEGLSKFITILHGGGLPDLLQYYKGEGGVSRDPKFVLRSIWTAPYNCPFTTYKQFIYRVFYLVVSFQTLYVYVCNAQISYL